MWNYAWIPFKRKIGGENKGKHCGYESLKGRKCTKSCYPRPLQQTSPGGWTQARKIVPQYIVYTLGLHWNTKSMQLSCQRAGTPELTSASWDKTFYCSRCMNQSLLSTLWAWYERKLFGEDLKHSSGRRVQLCHHWVTFPSSQLC